ncbi:trypsin-like peptidase domain-containing protein [Staphylococcus lloydii]|uniref:S1C family serine protease n=1 Tax=Staphylococcus lloydii TaxID=2781774 RepID=UPI002928F030|nr:trypsin-like peptidase domain-containing protein [Staphylococcus lloydii]MDU9417302.1 trypsin-like peptidase domain-containing protein [Staphylococcus lloydii]
MDKDKKQVIPRNKYRRTRRQFFHNEEREQRVKHEQQLRQQQAQKEAALAQNNKERVKENLQKSRIEKLTQEEIQHQQEIANQRNKVPATDLDETKNDSVNEHTSEEQLDNTSADDQQAVTEQHEQNDDDKQLDSTTEAESTTDNNQSKTDESLSQTSTNDNETASNEDHENESEQPFYTEASQQSRVNQFISDDEQYKETNGDDTYSTKSNSRDENSVSSRTKGFFTQNWAKILIVIGVILLLTLMNAIFNNVDHNGHQSNALFQSSNNHKPKYTDTMKSANSAIHSVVTVENDTSNSSSSVQKETKEARKDSELGSGVVYKKVGDSIFIVTNAHVVGDKEQQKITYGENKAVTGKVLGTDKWSDIAVVKAKLTQDSDVKAIKMGDSKNLILGEPLVVVGNPLGTEFKGSVSEGIISGLNRHVPVDIDKDGHYDVLMNAFQMDAPVNPGNSGGAVVNRDGKLIGIASMKISMKDVEGMAFAIPVNDVQSIVEQLVKNGEVKYPNTGVKIINTNDLDDSAKQSINLPSKVDKGVVVGEVKPKGPADKSGLQKNDVIVKLDGKQVEDTLRYRQIIFSHKNDLKPLSAQIYRDGKLKNIKLKLK